MFNYSAKAMALGLAVLCSLTVLSSTIVSAQQKPRSTADRKWNQGKGFWENSRASRNIQHAQDYSRSIQHYTTQVPTINPVIAQSESQMLGQQIQGVQREMVVIREQNADNPKIVQQVQGIETHLAQTANTQKVLHEECCKDSPDGHVCGDMALKINNTLEQVCKDHTALMKTMGQEDAAFKPTFGSGEAHGSAEHIPAKPDQ